MVKQINKTNQNLKMSSNWPPPFRSQWAPTGRHLFVHRSDG